MSGQAAEVVCKGESKRERERERKRERDPKSNGEGHGRLGCKEGGGDTTVATKRGCVLSLCDESTLPRPAI